MKKLFSIFIKDFKFMFILGCCCSFTLTLMGDLPYILRFFMLGCSITCFYISLKCIVASLALSYQREMIRQAKLEVEAELSNSKKSWESLNRFWKYQEELAEEDRFWRSYKA